MAPSKIYIFSLTLALALLSTFKTCSSRNPNTIYLYHDYINIENNMGRGNVLMIACYDTDKGTFLTKGVQALEYGQTVFWDAPVSPKAPIAYSCNMSSLDPHVHGTFDIFRSDRDFRSDKCEDDQCLWEVRVDGLWVYIKHASNYRKVYNWTPTGL